MTIGGIVDACKKEIPQWTLKDLDVTSQEVGLKASLTQVFRSFAPTPKGKGVMLTGTVEEIAAKLIRELKSTHVI